MFLILGPALNFLAGFFWEDDRQGITAGTLLALSCACWLIGLLGVYDQMRAVAPRYVSVAVPVAVFAVLGGIAFSIQSVHEGLFDVSHADAVERLVEYPFAANALYWIPGPLFPATLFALGFMLIRLRATPLPVGLLMCLGAIAFPLSRITREVSIAHVADLLLLLPFLYLGIRGIRTARTSQD
jgi:hypothetical protein